MKKAQGLTTEERAECQRRGWISSPLSRKPKAPEPVATVENWQPTALAEKYLKRQEHKTK